MLYHFQKGYNSDPSNVRPVSLLCGLGKLQERIVLKKIKKKKTKNKKTQRFKWE